MSKRKNAKLSQVQENELLTRLNEVKGDSRYSIRTLKKPPGFGAAQKLINAYHRRANTYSRRYSRRIEAAYRKAREIVLFSPPERALKAVQDFEKKRFL
jgi:hypothetical protein